MKTTSRDNTQKKKIAHNIFRSVGIPTLFAKKLIDEIIFILISNVVKKNHFKIKNFGIFNLKKKKKRTGRNPKNKINYEIKERNVLTFKAAIRLNKKVNIGDKK